MVPWHLTTDVAPVVMKTAAGAKELDNFANIACNEFKVRSVPELLVVDHDVQAKVSEVEENGEKARRTHTHTTHTFWHAPQQVQHVMVSEARFC